MVSERDKEYIHLSFITNCPLIGKIITAIIITLDCFCWLLGCCFAVIVCGGFFVCLFLQYEIIPFN